MLRKQTAIAIVLASGALASGCAADVSASELDLDMDLPAIFADGGNELAVPSPQMDESPTLLLCGGGFCDAGEICCPATAECVPASCPGCCSEDDYWRYEPSADLDPERLPDMNIAGDPPGYQPPMEAPSSRPGSPDPGPMPPE